MYYNICALFCITCISFIINLGYNLDTSDDTGKLLYYKSKGELRAEGEILITHATFSFDVKDKPGVFEIRYIAHNYITKTEQRTKPQKQQLDETTK